MVSTPKFEWSRRGALAGLAAALAAPSVAAAKRPKVITVLGDSITAGYGLPAEDAFPAQLGIALAQLGVSATVRGAGVSGDTTADALARVDFSVQSDTDLCLIALGGNDLLQGLDPSVMQANLTGIVRRLKARHIRVLLTGMEAPAAINAPYAHEYSAVFHKVARTEHIALYSFLLDGVALNSRLNQKDGIHPNAAGVKIVAGRLAPVVARALGERRKSAA